MFRHLGGSCNYTTRSHLALYRRTIGTPCHAVGGAVGIFTANGSPESRLRALPSAGWEARPLLRLRRGMTLEHPETGRFVPKEQLGPRWPWNSDFTRIYV